MSEYLTHNIVFEDLARLAPFSTTVSDTFKEAYRDQRLAGLLGSGTRKGGMYIIELLTTLRERANAGGLSEDDRTILGFTLGWGAHRAADRIFKPIYAELNPEYDDDVLPKPSDIRIYHDVILYQEVLNHGREEPTTPGLLDYYMEGHPAAGAVSPALTENLVGAHLQRTLLEQHSFVDREEDLDDWLTTFFTRIEPMYVDMERYAKFYHEPDLDALHRFILGPNFYDEEDPLIRLARSVQHGDADESIDMGDAMDAAHDRGSQYAQCLWLGMRMVEGFSDYYEGRIDAETARAVMNLNDPRVQLR